MQGYAVFKESANRLTFFAHALKHFFPQEKEMRALKNEADWLDILVFRETRGLSYRIYKVDNGLCVFVRCLYP